jgi:hypothetical protein
MRRAKSGWKSTNRSPARSASSTWSRLARGWLGGAGDQQRIAGQVAQGELLGWGADGGDQGQVQGVVVDFLQQGADAGLAQAQLDRGMLGVEAAQGG